MSNRKYSRGSVYPPLHPAPHPPTNTFKILFCIILPGQLCLQSGWSSCTGDSIQNYSTERQSSASSTVIKLKHLPNDCPTSTTTRLMYLVLTCLSWPPHLSLRCVRGLGSGLLSISHPDCQHLITWRVKEEAELSCDMIGLKGSNWQVKHLLNYLSPEGRGKDQSSVRLSIMFNYSTIYHTNGDFCVNECLRKS